MPSLKWTNAQVFLVTEFPWSVTVAWMGSYLSLFLLDQGLSARNLGWTIGAGAVIQLLGLGLSGSITRRLGRKGTIMSGDFGGWVVALGIWALSHNPWILALGLVMNQASGYVGPAWNSLFSEDEHSARLPRYFLTLQILTIMGGLILPLTRGFVVQDGVVASGHSLLLVFWPCVSAVWVIRWLALRESAAGRMSMGRTQRLAWRERAAHIHQGLSGPGFYLAALRVLSTVPFLIVAAFVPLALVSPHGPHVAPGDLTLLPLGAVSGVILLGIGRRVARRWTALHFMGMGLALVAAGFAVLAWAPQGHVIWVLAGWGLMVAGQSQFASSHTSIWMTWLPDVIRVDVQGWIGMVTAAGVAVLSPLLADQFVRNPRVVFGIMAVVFTAALGLWRPLRKLMAQTEHNES